MLVALAGPITNLVQAFVFGGLLRFFLEIGLFSETSFMAEILASIVILNIVLFLFNLVPLSPLDGWKILLGLLPAEQSWNLRRYEQESTFALVLILMVGVLNPNFNVIWLILGPIARLLFSLTTGGVVFY
jgi:Zn-dependent protease